MDPVHPFPAPRAGRLALALLAAAGALWFAAPRAAADDLKLVIILTRHGVRSPLQTPEALAKLSERAWPTWETPPGIQTPHGNQLIALLGDYYRARFKKDGLLTGDPAVDGPLVYLRADNDQRTIETTRILGQAFGATGEPDVHALPAGEQDPLFEPYRAGVGHPDLKATLGAVLGRVGGDPALLEKAYATQFEELDAVLHDPGARLFGTGPHTEVTAGTKRYLVTMKEPLLTAEQAVDSFILQYADGKPPAEVGWGKVTPPVLTDLLALHALFFDLANRTFLVAQMEGSNLASHIVDTIEQAAVGEPVPGAIGPVGEHILVLGGHDSNLANIGGLFGLNWWIDGTQANPVLPGGALLFEVWRHGSAESPTFYVRTTYVAQTLDQQHDAVPLGLETPPGLSPIFFPGCSGAGPTFDAPLKSFVRQARKVIDPAFIAPEP